MRRSEKNDRKISKTRIKTGRDRRRESFGKPLYDPVSDYLVYSRIQNTREDVEDGIQLVEELLEKLRKQW